MRIVARILFPVICVCLLVTAGNGNPPANMTADPALQTWFQSLKQPTTRQPCCSISDCHFTDFDTRDGHYEIPIESWKYIVPDAAVIHATENPYGRAVVCYSNDDFGPPERELRDTLHIFCFIPPSRTS